MIIAGEEKGTPLIIQRAKQCEPTNLKPEENDGMCSKHGIVFIQRAGGGIINHNSSWIIKPIVIKLKERCRSICP